MQAAVRATVKMVHRAATIRSFSGHCVVPPVPVLYLLSGHPARVSAW